LARDRLPASVAGSALLGIGTPAVDEVAAMARTREPMVRRLAVELVAQMGEPRHAPLLLHSLEDPVPDVRAKACRAAGRIGSTTVIDRLAGMLEDPAPTVRAAAAVGLGVSGDSRAIEPLYYLARWDSFSPARAAARALGQLDPQLVLDGARQPGTGPHLREEADRVAARVF
jgi:HEAT repeat protein